GAWVTLGLVAVVLAPYLTILGLGPGRSPRALRRFFGAPHRPDHVLAHGERLLMPALTLLPSLAIIIAGSTGMVDAALRLAHRWSVPDVIVGIVVLAVLARVRGVGRSEGVAILLLYAVFVAVQIVAEST